MEGTVGLARRLGGTYNVYKSHGDCLQVIRAVHDARPQWWNPRCTEFLKAAEGVRVCTGGASPPKHGPVILIEGLDGSGKTSIMKWLSEKLDGAAVCTPPPQWADIRPLYRDEDEGVARAFYSVANYMAADEILAAGRGAPFVVVDRWWCSTCAMALANQLTRATLPPEGDAVYQWPADLPRPDAGFFLHVDEAIRVARIRKRAPEDAEEQRLSSCSEMRATAAEAYRRTHVLTSIECPTYPVAVNTILVSLTEQGLHHTAIPFTQAEMDAVKPF